MSNPINNAASVQIVVADEIQNSGEKVKSIVVDTLVDSEIKRRTDALLAGISKLNALKKDLAKIDKADGETFIQDQGGNMLSQQTWSKGRLEEIKKAKEGVEKLDKAIADALELNTPKAFGDLYGLTK